MRFGDGAPRNRSGARHPAALAAVASGLVLLILAAVVACRAQPVPDVGVEEARRLATPTPARATPTASPRPSVRPVRLRIPSLALTATVNAVGIDRRTGEFAVPPSVDEVGWYRFGPGLDAPAGSVVVAGHVDGARQGKGAFFSLRRLDPGVRIAVTGADGRVREFRVVAREEYAKTRIPLDRYFARDGAPRLTLITCGGPFNPQTRRYRDNIVVTAVPA